MNHSLFPPQSGPRALHRILHPSAPAWSNRCHQLPALLPSLWRDWLFDQGSLTARLSALAPGSFQVRVLDQRIGQPSQLERQRLQLSAAQPIWIREVALCLGEDDVVYARTAVPLTTLRNWGCQLRGLGRRSLGSFLFSQPGIERQPLWVNRCNRNTLALNWCRHSVFSLRGSELMVTEAFSDKLLAYLPA